MTQQGYDNPFAPQQSAPSVSWANARPGDSITGRVVELPSMVQSRDFVTGKPETWEDGNPKLKVVTGLDVGGERRSLWCDKPSALYGAIVEALQRAGAEAVELGGTLRVTYTGDKPAQRAGMNPAKQYAVDYQAPHAFDGYGAPEGTQNGQNGGSGQPREAQGYQQPSREPSQLQHAQQAASDFRRDHQQHPVAPPQQQSEPPF